MNKTVKTVAVITIASAFVFAQGKGLGQFNDLSPSTIAATAATANSSISAVTMVYNTTTDEAIEIAAPVRDLKSQA
jgi:hypothetical protein